MFDGSPSFLIWDGKLVPSTMRRELISRPELKAIARRQGYESLDDIGTAVLETDGTVNFLRKGVPYDPSEHPPTPARKASPRQPRGATAA
jgi:uncharacterized membrane protein YcaP (DUF421 family)